MSQLILKFDAVKNQYEEIQYKRLVSEGSPESRTVYLLNENGLVSEELFYGEKETNPTKVIHKYDSNNFEVEYKSFTKDGALDDYQIFSNYKLDASGNWVERKKYTEFKGSHSRLIKSTEIQYRKITYYPPTK